MLKKTKKNSLPSALTYFLGLGILLLSFYFYWQLVQFYQTHFFPKTTVNGLSLDNLNVSQAQKKLSTLQIDPKQQISLLAGDKKLASQSGELDLVYDFDDALHKILRKQQSSSFIQSFPPFLFKFQSQNYQAELVFNQEAVLKMIDELASSAEQVGHPSSLVLNKTNDPKSLRLDPGEDALSLDRKKAYQLVVEALNAGHKEITLPLERKEQRLSLNQLALLQKQALNLVGKKIVLQTDQIDNFLFTIKDTVLIPLLNNHSASSLSELANIFTQLESIIDREPQEPHLDFDQESLKVKSFSPPLNGLALDKQALLKKIEEQMLVLEQSQELKMAEIDIPLNVISPKKSLSQTNNLGINDLLGFGESYYAHSIPGRVHNVALASQKLNLHLVPPGGSFSFNQAIGDVSAAAGYKEGYIIQGGRSELSAGGGVCQVSTTLFRALLNAGLKITLRLPHSYRVSYYELNNDPGFDATVYAGNIDLRFINDTQGYLLIVAQADSKNLYMNVRLYGTSDGRKTTVTNYSKSNFIKAPPPVYIPDPSLPPGKRQQIDWAVGGLSTNFTHTIYNADGSIREQKQYPSKYQAWSSKFLVGP